MYELGIFTDEKGNNENTYWYDASTGKVLKGFQELEKALQTLTELQKLQEASNGKESA